MQLNHINLCVENLEEAREFFQHYFDFQCLHQVGKILVLMTDGQGFILNLSTPHLFGSTEPIQPYPGAFHIGFLQPTNDQVDQMYRRLSTAAVQFKHEPKKIPGGYGFYFTAFNHLLIEVSCYAVPENNSR